MLLFRFIGSITILCICITGVGSIMGSFSAPGSTLGTYGGYVIWGLVVLVLTKSLFNNIRSSL